MIVEKKQGWQKLMSFEFLATFCKLKTQNAETKIIQNSNIKTQKINSNSNSEILDQTHSKLILKK